MYNDDGKPRQHDWVTGDVLLIIPICYPVLTSGELPTLRWTTEEFTGKKTVQCDLALMLLNFISIRSIKKVVWWIQKSSGYVRFESKTVAFGMMSVQSSRTETR